MDRGAWQAITHGVTDLDMTEHTHIHYQKASTENILYIGCREKWA